MRHSLRLMIVIVASVAIGAGGVLAAEKKKEADKSKTAAAAKSTDATAAKATAPEVVYIDKKHAPDIHKGWVALFNGKSLDGWKPLAKDQKMTWKAEDGILTTSFKEPEHGCNIVSEKTFTDFEFYCEFKVPKNGNSGVFVRGLFEIQIRGDYGMKLDDPAIDWGTGAFYGQKAPAKNASRPSDEWQSMYAKVVGDKASVFINGEQVQKDFVLAKPTHRYDQMKDVKESGPGPIILQGDHKPIEYRHVMIKPLEAKPAEAKKATESKKPAK